VTAVAIDRVSRSFGAVPAVREVSLDIRDGELFTLLGPSGCGKTTLLRMIAGFCELDSGTIRFGARRIDTLPAHHRNTGMVFQNYAIFPNLTVEGNVAYGLYARKVPAAQIAGRVATALKLVHLDGYAARWPHQLSGGQLQRVAIARALVIEPEVLLLDEPLSNLDAQLRVEMRGEVRQLQQSLGITAIYVTHDQEEALAISDRIAVMRAGVLEQVDRPDAIYRDSATPFVAEFLGITNLLSGTIASRNGARAVIRAGVTEFQVEGAASGVAAPGTTIAFCLRPEALRVLAPGEALPAGWASVAAQIARVEFLGALTRVETRLADGALLRVALLDQPLDTLVAGHTLDIKWSATQGWMIPTEAFGELCLVIGTRPAAPLVFDVGLIRCTAERLTERGNRDQKRTISAAGKRHIRWLVQGGVLRPNFLAALTDDVRDAVLAESSGQAKLRRLFTLLVGSPIPRDAIETLAQQRDPMRRLRSDRSDRLPGLKIFSSQYTDNQLAVRLLGYGEMPRDTFVAVPRERLSELPQDLGERLGIRSDVDDEERPKRAS